VKKWETESEIKAQLRTIADELRKLRTDLRPIVKLATSPASGVVTDASKTRRGRRKTSR